MGLESPRIPSGIKEILIKSKEKQPLYTYESSCFRLGSSQDRLSEGRAPVDLGLSKSGDAEQ